MAGARRDVEMTLRMAFDIVKAEDCCKNEGVGPYEGEWGRLVAIARDLLLMNGVDPSNIWHSSDNDL